MERGSVAVGPALAGEVFNEGTCPFNTVRDVCALDSEAASGTQTERSTGCPSGQAVVAGTAEGFGPPQFAVKGL
jgi:hypothetical protein